ncbi:MAG: hypothetical protein ABIV07_00490, partial [Polaromonas sp.]
RWFAQKREKGYRRAEECATGLYAQISHATALLTAGKLFMKPAPRGGKMECIGKNSARECS